MVDMTQEMNVTEWYAYSLAVAFQPLKRSLVIHGFTVPLGEQSVMFFSLGAKLIGVFVLLLLETLKQVHYGRRKR